MSIIIFLYFWPGMDISSDLVELGRTPVAVVCAGVKSILDIPRTLEYLVPIYFCVNITEALISCSFYYYYDYYFYFYLE